MKLYVGFTVGAPARVIRTATPPTSENNPEGFTYCVGPFRTRAGADVCASGEHSPHRQTVSEFERVARTRKRLAHA